MHIVDGRLIARELRNALRERVQHSGRSYTLAVIVAEETPEIQRFKFL